MKTGVIASTIPLPDRKNTLWQNLAFTGTIIVSIVVIMGYFQQKRLNEKQHKLLDLSIKKTRMDLGLPPDGM